ncbi:hypothetical protein ACNKHW_15300 [Shigella flexneri]
MEEEGILQVSSGAAVAAALKLQKMKALPTRILWLFLPSSGERYLSTALFAKYLTRRIATVIPAC